MTKFILRALVLVAAAGNGAVAIAHWASGNTLLGNTFFIIGLLWLTINWLEMIYAKVEKNHRTIDYLKTYGSD